MFALAVFVFSLVGIAALFALKYWEAQRGRIVAPVFRARADAQAMKLKVLLAALRIDLAKIPPEAAHLARLLVHVSALQAAHLARALEAQAHRLADLVSHKHRFERRPPRSEFLKKVIEHKNGGGQA